MSSHSNQDSIIRDQLSRNEGNLKEQSTKLVTAPAVRPGGNPTSTIQVPTSSLRSQAEVGFLHNPEIMGSETSSNWMTQHMFPPFYQKAGWRKGKWLEEEEAYTKKLIETFSAGFLNLPSGTTLRSFLSERLSCDPMRITKKFAGSSCIGKQIYVPCDSRTDPQLIIKAQNELKELEDRFRAKVDVQRAVDYYPVSPVALAVLQQQQQAALAAYHVPQGFRVDNLPPEYVLALQGAGLPLPMMHRGSSGDAPPMLNLESSSASSRSFPQQQTTMLPAMLKPGMSNYIAPELLLPSGQKQMFRSLSRTSMSDLTKLNQTNTLEVGKNGLGVPILLPGAITEPATAARVLGLRPYPTPDHMAPLMSTAIGFSVSSAATTGLARELPNAPGMNGSYQGSMNGGSNLVTKPSSSNASSSGSNTGARPVNTNNEEDHLQEEEMKVAQSSLGKVQDTFVSLTNKDLYASHLLMNFFNSAATTKESNSERSSNSDEPTSSKNGQQSTAGSMQQTDGDGNSSSPPSESDVAQDESNGSSNGSNGRFSSSGNHRKGSTGSTSDANYTDEENGDHDLRDEVKLTKRALKSEPHGSGESESGSGDVKRRRLNGGISVKEEKEGT